MGCPRAAQTNAREMPVVPAVYSTTVPSAARRPLASARSMAVFAMRSFMLPVGFAHSSLATTRAEPAGTIFFNSTSGVLPMPPRTLCMEDDGGFSTKVDDQAGDDLPSAVALIPHLHATHATPVEP